MGIACLYVSAGLARCRAAQEAARRHGGSIRTVMRPIACNKIREIGTKCSPKQVERSGLAPGAEEALQHFSALKFSDTGSDFALMI
jgi:hypothetical protein